MSKKYTEEVFNFFTKNENRFIMMGKVAQHESIIKKKLIEGFWKELKNELNKIFDAEDKNWVIRFSDNFSIPHNKIIIYRKDWPTHNPNFPLVSIAFENLYWLCQPYIGILVDTNFWGGDNSYNTEEIKKLIRETEEFLNLGITKNKWYPVKRNISLSLENYDRLVDILPMNKKNTIDSLVKEAKRYFEVLDNFMKMNDNLKGYKIEK